MIQPGILSSFHVSGLNSTSLPYGLVSKAWSGADGAIMQKLQEVGPIGGSSSVWAPLFRADPRPAVLNLWGASPLGVACQISYLSDIYITINNNRKITVGKHQ